MSYAEKRNGKLTGRFIAEVRSSGIPKKVFFTKKEADDYENQIRLQGGLPDTVPGVARTFKAVARELIEAGGPHGTWAKGKDRSVFQRLNEACETPRFGDLPINEVTFGAVEKLVEKLKQRDGQKGAKLALSTVNKYLTAISAVLRYAARKGYITAMPEIDWQKTVAHVQEVYTPEQEAAILKVLRADCSEVYATLVECLIEGGMRVGELLGATERQVKGRFLYLDDPNKIKNGKPRLVRIGAENGAKLLAFIKSGSIPTYQQLDTQVRRALKKCGLQMSRPIHAFRHTRATRVVARTGDIYKAQKVLGHKSINTTLRYVHSSEAEMEKFADELHEELTHTVGKSAEVVEEDNHTDID